MKAVRVAELIDGKRWVGVGRLYADGEEIYGDPADSAILHSLAEERREGEGAEAFLERLPQFSGSYISIGPVDPLADPSADWA